MATPAEKLVSLIRPLLENSNETARQDIENLSAKMITRKDIEKLSAEMHMRLLELQVYAEKEIATLENTAQAVQKLTQNVNKLSERIEQLAAEVHELKISGSKYTGPRITHIVGAEKIDDDYDDIFD